jgi:hypothetical protein
MGEMRAPSAPLQPLDVSRYRDGEFCTVVSSLKGNDMKKHATPKIKLSKETLRALESETLTQALGGLGDGRIDTTWPSCPSKCETC